MIDEQRTLELFGYTSDSLSKGSHKKVVRVCDKCGKNKYVEFRSYKSNNYPNLCMSCIMKGKILTDEHKNNLSIANTGKKHTDKTKEKMKNSSQHLSGKNHPMFGKHHSEESKQMMSKNTKKLMGENSPSYGKKVSLETRQKLSDAGKGRIVSEETKYKLSGKNNPFYGKQHSDESKIKMSCIHQGIDIEDFDGFLTEQKYCKKFNESCRERNREKYDRECFICGKLESENFTKTGKLRKLSVHHVDMNKNQGCNDHEWALVPVCLKHHIMLHTKLWEARIKYILNNEIN